MATLERIAELTNKLYDLLSQAEEIRNLIQERDTATSELDESDTEDVSLEETELKTTWCSCFSRKQKLN
jgi:hypothetical protein